MPPARRRPPTLAPTLGASLLGIVLLGIVSAGLPSGLLAAATLPALGAEAPVYPPSSRFGMAPAPDMTLSRRFTGFERPEGGAMVSVVELAGEAYPEVERSFTDDNLKSQGFSVESREALKVSGDYDAVLFTGGQPATDAAGGQADGGPAVRKWILLVDGRDVTGIIVAQITPGAETEATVRGMLTGVRLRAPLSLEQQVGALPFRLGDLAGFRPLRVLAGNSVLLTRGPKDQPTNFEQPILVLAQAVQQPPTAEQRDAFAKAALFSNQTMKDVMIERSQSYRSNGVDWHEIVARATDIPTETKLVVSQTIRFQPDGYLRSLGVVRAEQRDETLALFREAVDSVQIK